MSCNLIGWHTVERDGRGGGMGRVKQLKKQSPIRKTYFILQNVNFSDGVRKLWLPKTTSNERSEDASWHMPRVDYEELVSQTGTYFHEEKEVENLVTHSL